jgi:hypothetical protein
MGNRFTNSANPYKTAVANKQDDCQTDRYDAKYIFAIARRNTSTDAIDKREQPAEHDTVCEYFNP